VALPPREPRDVYSPLPSPPEGSPIQAAQEEPTVKNKETVLLDVTNSGVMAALIGGFALTNLQSHHFEFETSDLDNVIYLLLVFAVHSCTCAALTSALLYRNIIFKPEAAVPAWASKNWMLLIMPIAKFGMGTASYILAVLIASYRTLEPVETSRFIACSIGVMSMMTVVMTLLMLQFDYVPSFLNDKK